MTRCVCCREKQRTYISLSQAFRIERRHVPEDLEAQLRHTVGIGEDLADLLVGRYLLPGTNKHFLKPGVHRKIVAMVYDNRAAQRGDKRHAANLALEDGLDTFVFFGLDIHTIVLHHRYPLAQGEPGART